MFKEADQFADEAKKVKERVDPKNPFDGYFPSLRFPPGGSGDTRGLREKMDSDEKEKFLAPLKDAHWWLVSTPGADAGEFKEKPRGVGGFCPPFFWKYYGRGGASSSRGEGDGEGAPAELWGGPFRWAMPLVPLCSRSMLPIPNVKTGVPSLGMPAPVFLQRACEQSPQGCARPFCEGSSC
eukprot:UN4881